VNIARSIIEYIERQVKPADETPADH
jgi:hypothetical protein